MKPKIKAGIELYLSSENYFHSVISINLTPITRILTTLSLIYYRLMSF